MSDEDYIGKPIPTDGETGEQYEMVIKTTITVEQVVPITKMYYPDELTIGDAVDFERKQAMPEKIETFTENIANRLGDEVNFGETIIVQRVQRKAEDKS